jgi:hypothetical protein
MLVEYSQQQKQCDGIKDADQKFVPFDKTWQFSAKSRVANSTKTECGD